MLGNQMNDVLMALHAAADEDQPRAHHHLAVALQHLRPDHGIGHARLVLQRHEDHALGGAGTLADQDDAGDRDADAIGELAQVGAGRDAIVQELCA